MTEFLEQLKYALFGRRDAFIKTFRGPVAAEVLKDLARFCRAHEPTYHPDARVHSLLEGRREVWLRIQNHLNLTPDQLWELYSGRPSTKED
jgi:hypothetical protein